VPPPLTRCLPSPMTSKIGQGAGGLCYKARREGMREEKGTLELRPRQLLFTSLFYHLASRTCQLACARTRRPSVLQIFGTDRESFSAVNCNGKQQALYRTIPMFRDLECRKWNIRCIIRKYKQNHATRALAVELSYFQFGGRDPFAL
ncbi:hypothetical protein ALC62_03350, partial [Cyphomyrmex costatus]